VKTVPFFTFLRFSTCLCDFEQVLCYFKHFQVLPPFLHVLGALTRKIVRFYELKRIFNNHGPKFVLKR
jgi:hypothetical protein